MTANNSFKAVLFIFQFFLISNNIFSQHDYLPGYIVTKQNDTIHGYIDDKSSSASLKICMFKKEENQDAIEYTADSINSYRFVNGRYFVSYRLVKENFEPHVFFEYLLKGTIQVFRSVTDKNNSFYIKKDTLLVLLDNKEISYTDEKGINYVTQSKKYKGTLNYLMRDQPELKNQINQFNTLSANNLIKLSKKYHSLSCPDKECIDYSKSEKVVKVQWGIGFTYGLPNLYLDEYVIPNNYYDARWNFNRNYFYNLRIPFDIQFINISRKISLLVSPGISKTHFNSNQYWESRSNLFYKNINNIDFASIDIPVCFKYTMKSSSWKVWPIFGLGFQFSSMLNPKAEFYVWRKYGTTISETTSTHFEFSTFQNSLFLIAGADVPLKTKKVSLFANYQAGDGIHRLKYVDSFLKISKTNMLSFGGVFIF